MIFSSLVTFNNKILCEMARKHHKSVAQIVLRWLVQREIVPGVKSANPIRMRANPYKSKEKHPVGELPGVSRGV